MKKILVTAIFAILLFQAKSQMPVQDTVYRMSLQEAIDYASQHNLQVINGQLDIKKARWQIWQTTAMGLPQANASLQYTQYPSLPTQLMPNFLSPVITQVNMQVFGLQPVAPLPDPNEKIPVQFGSKYNAQWGITVNQLIFSGEYLVGLYAARIFKQLAEENYMKTLRDLKASVEQSYVLVLIAQESKRIMQKSYQNTLELKKNTDNLVASGMADQIQADQMNYLVSQMENQLRSVDRQYQLALRLLKFQLGLDMDDSLVLTSNIDDVISNIKLGDYLDTSYSVQQNIDYRLIMTREQLARLDMRREQAKLLPQVAGFFTYSKNAMRDEFNFFDNNQEWFKTSMFGLKVQMPLWGSGSKIASIQQKKMDYIKAQNTREMMGQQLKIQYRQAVYNFVNAYERMLNEKNNIDLTRKIYENTRAKYLSGAASSLELTQAQNQYLQAEGNYYKAMMDLIKAKTDLDKFIQ